MKHTDLINACAVCHRRKIAGVWHEKPFPPTPSGYGVTHGFCPWCIRDAAEATELFTQDELEQFTTNTNKENT